ncbi:MAG: DUF475 domain-containing protein [Frankia sp.]
MHTLRIFGWSLALTVVVIAGAGILGGGQAAAIVAILAVLEISLSFDNAVINATVLGRMNEFWQKIFLTIGVLIAVFGMRLLFPIIVVALTAHLSPSSVIDLALNKPSEYSDKLTAAHPSIAAFGGIFLFMIFLDFMFDEEREVQWLKTIEGPLAKAGRLEALSTIVALISLLVVGEAFSGSHTQQVLTAGVAGLATYLAVGGLSSFFEASVEDAEEEADPAGKPAATRIEPVDPVGSAPAAPTARSGGSGAKTARLATGKAAFFLFLYLEVLDASFSFDGVVGAFAITQKIFIIAAGLGIGALYIRSLTVYLVRKGTLGEYVYLEHGAHYAIGALAIILAISIENDVPEIVTGLIGVGFIAAAFVSSLLRKRRMEETDHDAADEERDIEPAHL